jgi:hypothetical protein
MRSSCSTEFYECHRTEPIGLARSRHDLAVSRLVFAVFLATPSPAFLRLRVHPLVGLLPLQRTSPVFICTPLSLRAPSLGFPIFLYRDTSASSPLTAGIPCPAFVPPTAFLTLSTVYSSLHLAGLFHPAATSEIHSSGVSPSSQPSGLSPFRALLSFVPVAYREASFSGPAPDLRLQGVTPTAGPL